MNADVNNENSSSVLPAEYSEVAPVAQPKADVRAPTTQLAVKAKSTALPASIKKEQG